MLKAVINMHYATEVIYEPIIINIDLRQRAITRKGEPSHFPCGDKVREGAGGVVRRGG